MIDKRKNVCYVIHVYYRRGGKEHSCRFVSQHQAGSKRFKEFSDDYFKSVFPVNKDKFGDFDGVTSSQETITWKEWPNRNKDVMDGITRKEMCH